MRRRVENQTRLIEEAVMDMADAGAARAHIIDTVSRQFGCSRRTAEGVLDYMRENKSDDAFSAPVISEQTEALLAAIRLHHPNQCEGAI